MLRPLGYTAQFFVHRNRHRIIPRMSDAGMDEALAFASTRTPARWTGAAGIAAVVLVFSGLSLACAALSDGFVTADACTHYLYAKYALGDPVNLVDVWARPFCTALFALPAHWGGRLAVRVTSLAVALACGVVAAGIARGQGTRRDGSLALLFTLAQPLLFVYSFSEMTELPFALLLGGAFWAYQKRQWLAAAILLGLTPTARPEGFGFLFLGLAAFVVHRRWLAAALLMVPLLGWDLGGWWVTGRADPWWRWLPDAWPWSTQSLYGRGSPLTFVAALPLVCTPLALPALLVGTGRALGLRPRRDRAWDHLHWCRFLSGAIPAAVLVGHSLLRWTGKLGSFGEPRYLLVVAPFWGVLCAQGWRWLFERFGWHHPLGWAGAVALVPIGLNVAHPAVPVHLEGTWVVAQRFAQLYRTSPSLRRQYPNVIASHPGVFYFLDEDPTGHARRGGFTRGLIEAPPTGTLLIWDPDLGARNANADDAATLDAIARAGWVPAMEIDRILHLPTDPRSTSASPERADGQWHVFQSPEHAPG